MLHGDLARENALDYHEEEPAVAVPGYLRDGFGKRMLHLTFCVEVRHILRCTTEETGSTEHGLGGSTIDLSTRSLQRGQKRRKMATEKVRTFFLFFSCTVVHGVSSNSQFRFFSRTTIVVDNLQRRSVFHAPCLRCRGKGGFPNVLDGVSTPTARQ